MLSRSTGERFIFIEYNPVTNMRLSLIFFLFAMSTTLKAQTAGKIHFDAVLVDTHNDFLSKAVEDSLVFDQQLKGTTYSDLSRMAEGGVKVQVFSVFCDDHFGKGSAFAYANRELDTLYAIIARNPKTMKMAYTYKDILKAIRHNQLACLSGVEGGHMIEDNLEYI